MNKLLCAFATAALLCAPAAAFAQSEFPGKMAGALALDLERQCGIGVNAYECATRSSTMARLHDTAYTVCGLLANSTDERARKDAAVPCGNLINIERDFTKMVDSYDEPVAAAPPQ